MHWPEPPITHPNVALGLRYDWLMSDDAEVLTLLLRGATEDRDALQAIVRRVVDVLDDPYSARGPGFDGYQDVVLASDLLEALRRFPVQPTCCGKFDYATLARYCDGCEL